MMINKNNADEDSSSIENHSIADDDEECRDLLPSPDKNKTTDGNEIQKLITNPFFVFFTLLLVVTVIVGTSSFLLLERRTNTTTSISYQCPSTIPHAENDIKEYFDDYLAYDNKSLTTITNSNNQKDNYQDGGYDGYYVPYETHKNNSISYKSQVFCPSLHSGDSIYESACGTGLNLLMTLEIMEEYCNITNLQVYGNDYLHESVEISGDRLRRKSNEKGGKRWDVQTLCGGDSTDLNFIPSDTFDLTFTGYIDPLTDPLKLLPDDAPFNKHRAIEKKLCQKKGNEKQRDEMQRKQEDWYASWVSELVRIARPGGTVVIEEVSVPLCEDMHDWGGVSRSWWVGAVELYGWDVDVGSMVLMDAAKEPGSGRYNVVMKKN